MKNQRMNKPFMGHLNADIQIVDTEALNHTSAEIIIHYIREKLKIKEFFTLVLSGGATPEDTFALLASDASFRFNISWDKVHFFWGDERHVPPDHKESNYRMANEVMLSRLPVPKENIHRIITELPDANESANLYEKELCIFFKLERGQLPCFDCVLLGMGADGHTASLFPETKALIEKSHLVVANWIEKFKTYRITLTLPVLNNADFILFLVRGKEKANTLKEVVEGKGHPTPLPAQLIKPTHGKLLWLVDKAVASHLTHL